MDVKYDSSNSTAVEIYGQTYNVRGEGDPNYLAELARFVDSRMRDVAAQVATVDPAKIAILAALNIADEFSRYRKEREDAVGVWIEKTEEITSRLNEVMG
jgi:cell division protein ZapA